MSKRTHLYHTCNSRLNIVLRTIGDYLFSMYANFPEKLPLRTHWHAHVRIIPSRFVPHKIIKKEVKPDFLLALELSSTSKIIAMIISTIISEGVSLNQTHRACHWHFYIKPPDAATRGVPNKKDVLKNFAKFTGKYLCCGLFFN